MEKKSEKNIDQIRQLIFGEQIRTYERSFKELSKQIDQLDLKQKEMADSYTEQFEKLMENHAQKYQEIVNLVKKNRTELLKGQKDLEAQFNKKMDELSSDKVDLLQLANLLIDLGMRLKGEDVLQQLSEEGESATHV